MSKKSIILIVCLVVAISGCWGCYQYTNGGKTTTSSLDGHVEVTFERAIFGESICYITVEEGQNLVIEVNLPRGSVDFKLGKDINSIRRGFLLAHDKFKGTGVWDFSMPAGEYTCKFTTMLPVTGGLKVFAR